jgi:putative PIN family toxin of toxin-antitoxin system
MAPRVVLDTNVLVAAIRSRRGASFKLLSLAGTGAYDLAVSVPLLFEYEDVLERHLDEAGLREGDLANLLDFLCSLAVRQEIFFLWRPFLRDPHDDLLLELAVAAQCDSIVTFNTSHFSGVDAFGIIVQTPRDLLYQIGAAS